MEAADENMIPAILEDAYPQVALCRTSPSALLTIWEQHPGGKDADGWLTMQFIGCSVRLEAAGCMFIDRTR